MPTKAIEVLKRNMYEWKQCKKNDENGQLSCVIYSPFAAACLLLQRLGRRSLDTYLFKTQFYQYDQEIKYH